MTEEKSRRFIRVHISDVLYTTARYDDCFWDKEKVYIQCPSGVKTYDRSKIKGLEIFEV